MRGVDNACLRHARRNENAQGQEHQRSYKHHVNDARRQVSWRNESLKTAGNRAHCPSLQTQIAGLASWGESWGQERTTFPVYGPSFASQEASQDFHVCVLSGV